MKKSTLFFAIILLGWQTMHALTVSVNGLGEVSETGLELTVTETEDDPLSGTKLMSLHGSVQSTDSLRVTITRSVNGLVDEFCCASVCTPGNRTHVQELTFAPSEGTQWFVHYTPAEASYETISYLFRDGDDSRLVTVHYNNGGEPRPTSFVRKHLIEEFTGQVH